MENNKTTDTIVFYGKDNTPLEEAYIKFSGEPAKQIRDLADYHIYLEILKRYLIDLNKDISKDSVDIIGHSEKAVDNKKSYTLFSPEFLKLSDPEKLPKTNETDSDGENEAEDNEGEAIDTQNVSEDNEGKEKPPVEKFANLVGTIRKTYSKNDTSFLIRYLNHANVKDTDVAKKFGCLVKKRGKSKETELVIKLVVSSRFDTVDIENQDNSKNYFLADLLLSSRLNLKFNSKHHVDFDYDSLFDFYLLWILLDNFDLASKKGYFKKYQRFEKNDRKIKGSIDFARHLKLNMGMDNGCIAYSYRENTLDNEVNHLILAAFDYLKDKYPIIVDNNMDFDLYARLNSLKYEIGYPKYSHKELINLNSTPISHPFFSEYRELQKNCLKILRDEGVSPFGNEDEHVSGILYYVPDLWEDYLLNTLKKASSSINQDNEKDYQVKVCAQKDINVFAGLKGKGVQVTYPDYVFEIFSSGGEDEKTKPFFILDAKYKSGWFKSLNGSFDSYLIEDYNKCIRDMGSIQAMSTGVIIPAVEDDMDNIDEAQLVHRFSEYNDLNCFYTIPVKIPKIQSEQFWEWQLSMKNALKDVEELFRKIIDFEAEQYIAVQKALSKIKKNNLKFLTENIYYPKGMHRK